MTAVTIYGPPQSSYVRTARLTCEEKGVDYALEPVEFGSDAHLALHPFGKVPVLKHADMELYETSAISRYIDETFDGPALVPSDTKARSRMEQIISCVNCYLYDDLIRKYLFSYIFPKTADKQPDRKTIDAIQPNLKRDIALLNDAARGQVWLAGETLSLADLFVGPIVFYVGMFPEGQQALERAPELSRVFAALSDRPSFAKTAPPPPPKG